MCDATLNREDPKKRNLKNETHLSEALSRQLSRRSFVTSTVVASTAAAAGDSFAAIAPSNQITVGVIGCGSRGTNLIDSFKVLPDCRIVAICDVDDFHYRDQDWGKGPTFGRRPAAERINKAYASAKSGTPAKGLQVYSDYRDITGREDIDAVIVATPDHWHARCTFDALRAGKDVYCEKPVTHLFSEGRTIVTEVANRKAVFQTGSQQRSDPLFHRVVELAGNGVLGKIEKVEVGLPPGYGAPMGSTDVVKPREDLDYDFWCGPSPVLPLMQARHHRWWRGHRAYGGGVLMDWIGHHNDIAHWAIGKHRSGPVSVEAIDWTFPETKVYDTPEQYTIRCEYEEGITSTISSKHPVGLKIIGSEGWVYAKRGKADASDKRWLAKSFQSGSFQTKKPASHAADFLNCIKSREECIAPAEIAHRSITPGHLGYVSYALGRPLSWDAERQKVTGDTEANTLLNTVRYRTPWQVPGTEETA